MSKTTTSQGRTFAAMALTSLPAALSIRTTTKEASLWGKEPPRSEEST